MISVRAPHIIPCQAYPVHTCRSRPAQLVKPIPQSPSMWGLRTVCGTRFVTGILTIYRDPRKFNGDVGEGGRQCIYWPKEDKTGEDVESLGLHL
ncbi:hypothetical protein PoB_006903000 [Plakobranchus ocellatus]|uniref:Uncharacterized protein n=1 Tax=Plakobranchus ocellatus TaxID=259542 RepID=A0AAV4DEV9_9GAST|nr:hypothetical protein PoB_006903000 [Plakobranchus ocellatus]